MGECMHAESVGMCDSRVCCCTAPLARVRPCWPGQWPTTQTAPSSGCLAVSWCRSTLGRAVVWSESSLSWLGDLCVCVMHSILCVCPVAWSESSLSWPGDIHICVTHLILCLCSVVWLESSLSWPGDIQICVMHSIFCVCSVVWSESSLSWPGDLRVCVTYLSLHCQRALCYGQGIIMSVL